MAKESYKKDSMPRDKHWEKHLTVSLAGKGTPDGAFLPRQAKDRPTPHVKINECDH